MASTYALVIEASKLNAYAKGHNALHNRRLTLIAMIKLIIVARRK